MITVALTMMMTMVVSDEDEDADVDGGDDELGDDVDDGEGDVDDDGDDLTPPPVCLRVCVWVGGRIRSESRTEHGSRSLIYLCLSIISTAVE